MSAAGIPAAENTAETRRFFFDSTVGFVLGIVGLLLLMLAAIAIVVLLVGHGHQSAAEATGVHLRAPFV